MNRKTHFSLFKMLLIFIILSLNLNAISTNFLIENKEKLSIINKIKDINGKTYSLKNKICVFVFIDIECPISQFYTKTLQNIYLKYAKREIVFSAVFQTKYISVEEIKSFNKKYNLTIPSVLDKYQHITKQLNARITPEVFVLNQKNEIVYSGCIDDSFFAVGKRNINPKNFYLEQTLDLILKNKNLLKSHIEAIGCEIQRIP